MIQQYGILIMMFLISVAAGLAWMACRKGRYGGTAGEDCARIVFCSFFCEYFLVSAVKWRLGSPENTLPESFWDAGAGTYLHYGIPLAAASAGSAVLAARFFHDQALKQIRCFDAVMAAGGIFLLAGGRVGNRAFCMIFAACAAVTLAVTFGYRRDMAYMKGKEWRERFRQTAPLIACMAVMAGVYFPNELYLNNLEEFFNPYISFFFILLAGSLVMGTVIFLGLLFLPEAWFQCAALVLSGMAFMGYLQAMFLNGQLASLTGEEQSWPAAERIFNLAIWGGVILFVVFLGYYKKGIARLYRGICIYICLTQLAALGYLVITTDTSEKGKQAVLTTQGALEIAEDKNVLVFVLDLFDSTLLQEIMDKDSGFAAAPLADFVYYRNATSTFGHTNTAIPYLLTGTAWREGTDADEYADYAYAPDDVTVRRMWEQGYDVGIYTSAHLLREPVYHAVSNYREGVERRSDAVKTFSTMLRASMYKMLPFSLKNRYSYYSSDITEMVKADDVWNIDNDLPFYHSLMQTGLSVGGYSSAFRFYHMRGAHDPFYLSEDLQYDSTGREVTAYSQAKGCLRIVYEYLARLKALGKYEDAAIIITADHGNITRYDSASRRPDVTTMPVLLVKEPGQRHDSLTVRSAPVTQGELRPTLMKAAGLDWHQYGRALEEVGEEEERERIFTEILQDAYIIRYAVNGDAWNIENWKAVQEIWLDQ